MDNIYQLYCKILEQTEKINELVPDDDGIILKMHKDILLIQYETLLDLLQKEIVNIRNEYNKKLDEKYCISIKK